MFFMWAAIFFLIAIVAATFGFTDISADASHIAKNPVLHFFGGLFNFAPFWIPPVQKVKSVAHGIGAKDNWRGLVRKMK